MAVSYTSNVYGLLNAWQRINQEGIWRFNQDAGTGAPLQDCSVYIQQDREQIAEALNTAWHAFSEYLGYFPRPVWTSETVRLGRGYPYQFQRLRASHGYITEFGQRATSLIEAGAVVTYSASGATGAINDTATLTVNTTVDIDEIQVFFRTADGALGAGDERFQIEPLRLTASGGVVTITGHRALFTSPALIWDIPFTPTDPNYQTRNFADTANGSTGFVTAVDVYRVYNDATITGQLISDPIWTRGTDLGGNILTSADVRLTDALNGRFEVRTDCSAVLACTGPIEAVKVYYKSGYPLEFGNMAGDLQRALIRLANANMYRKLCTFCPETATIWDDDRQPPGSSENPVAQRWIDNPFGTMKGQIAAWQTAYRKALVQGGVL
jgi:hypothetical protein